MAHRLEYICLWLAKGLVGILPLKSARRLAEFLGGAAFMVAGGRRRVALDNLRFAFPEKTEKELLAITREAFTNYATMLVELLWFPNFTPETLARTVQLQHPEVFEAACKKGRGIIVVSAHYGNWELNALAIGTRCPLPVSIIVQTQSNKLADGLINKHRTLRGNRVVPMGISVREILRALRDKEVIALLPDQSGPEDALYVEFFGRFVSAHQGPAVFALRTKAILLFSLSMRQKDGNYMTFFEEIPTDDVMGETPENVELLTIRYTTLLESYIRKDPGKWLWMHKRWKHLRPEPATEAVAQ
jgi:KDO2-lipid IV(A) lauroyltransferase